MLESYGRAGRDGHDAFGEREDGSPRPQDEILADLAARPVQQYTVAGGAGAISTNALVEPPLRPSALVDQHPLVAELAALTTQFNG